MAIYELDPDVVRWGLHLLDDCTLSHHYSPSIVTQYDPDLSQVEYVTEGFCQHQYVDSDEAVAQAYQEELWQLDSMVASGISNFENEGMQGSVYTQDWPQSSNGNDNLGNESCQNSVGESYNMKEVGNYGPTPSERKNDVHENDVCGSSSGSVEVPATATSDDFWDSLEISDESLDGEVGKRLNQMVPIPHVPKTNEKIPSDDEEISDHQRLLDRLQLYDLIECKVQGDGNCQFRSLSDQLYRSPDHHKFVREQIIQQLKYYPDLYAGYVPLAYSDYLRNMSKYVHISHYAMLFLIMWLYFMSFVFTASFLCGCTRSGEWGDHVTLQAAADWYGVKIFVITSFKDTCYIEILPQIQKSERVIFLSFWAEVHYNSIYPEGDSELPSSHTKKKKKWWNFAG
ncbi:OVARIAN TUMOR DOMAIN-containing deubiquitinating enzyme 9 isoform X1 [Glycine max]|uniref:OVARIAN TUMOR DOMAIN-containing deubiquitinating enzyme 9 isoform X1 n=1 Tax=Glycine max TaxID=3847 RepID=UPI001B3574FB|nr:OVARIAN TUMOR DOMAIN-containing deubiquitinating enzyme 9 isoform X1 [Glycine max]XP_040861795.1 OVARIAN TUMOR DOMAIN-containing deubiquitinating enzyme 9 isoform X1 [Glycine max]